MLFLVLAELMVLAVLCVVFIGLHARTSWWDSPAGRQLMAMAVVVLAEAGALFALGSGWGPPLWVYALVFGAADAVMAGWLLLLWRARRGGDE